jgi:uncharacterized membrane protein HdeD (DUF308 family)
MASELIQSVYRRTWWALVLRGLFGIALGAIILWRPIESIASFALVIALWASFSGAVQIVHAIDLRDVFPQWWVMVLGGLVSVAFGVAAVYYYPVLSLTFAVVWAAWWLLFTGGLGIYIAMQERSLGMPWGWTFVFGLSGIVASALAFMNPPATLGAIMGLIAGFAIVSGVVLLVGAYKLSTAKERIGAALGAARPV